MTIGASLFLIAVGAILRFAVTATVGGVDLQTVGMILMVVGAIGVVLGLFLMMTRRRTDVIDEPGRRTYLTPGSSIDPSV